MRDYHRREDRVPGNDYAASPREHSDGEQHRSVDDPAPSHAERAPSENDAIRMALATGLEDHDHHARPR